MDTNDRVKAELQARVKGSKPLSRGEMSALVAEIQNKFQKRASDALVAFGMGLQGGAGGDKGTFFDRVNSALEKYDKDISKIVEYLRLGRQKREDIIVSDGGAILGDRGIILDNDFRSQKVDLWLRDNEKELFRAAFGGGGLYAIGAGESSSGDSSTSYDSASHGAYRSHGTDSYGSTSYDSYGRSSYGRSSYGRDSYRRDRHKRKSKRKKDKKKKTGKRDKERARVKAKALKDKIASIREKARLFLDKKQTDAALLVAKKVAKHPHKDEALILARQLQAYGVPSEVKDGWMQVVQKLARAHRAYAPSQKKYASPARSF